MNFGSPDAHSAQLGALAPLIDWTSQMAGFDYLLLEPLAAAEPRLGRRTARTLPLLPPPQKN